MTEQSTMSIDKFGDKYWKLPNGDFHREDGPAIEYSSGAKSWCINGRPHRTDGPAVVYSNGLKDWYSYGKNIFSKSV